MEGDAVQLYQLTICISASDANRSKILKSLRRLQGPTEARRGCRRLRIYEGVDAAEEIMLIEEWEDREAVEAYLQSKDFGVVLSLVDLSEVEPAVRLDRILAREGVQQFTGNPMR